MIPRHYELTEHEMVDHIAIVAGQKNTMRLPNVARSRSPIHFGSSQLRTGTLHKLRPALAKVFKLLIMGVDWPASLFSQIRLSGFQKRR